MRLSDLIASIGVTLLLIAFFLNLTNTLKAGSKFYLYLNVLGAGLCCLSSYMIRFYPFVVLEGAWALVAVWSLFAHVPRETSTKEPL